jgi:hypothetical protein
MENFALVVRAAAFSWEASTILLASVQETAPIKMQFPRPVTIVSVYPSVSPISGDDALPVPTLDDLLVRIDQEIGGERRLTTRFDSTQTNGIGSLPNVTLGSYRDTTGGARVLNLELGDAGGARPELQIAFSWKRPILNGPYFQDVQCGLVFHCNFR